MPTFKLDEAVRDQLGGTVKNLNPDGTVQVLVPDPKTGEEVERRFDHMGFMRSMGVDPAKVDIQYNTPDSAADAADLSFATKVKLSLAGSEQDQVKQLKEQFGDDAVMEGPEGPVVRENGVWKKAEGSFLASLAANVPEMSAGMAGRVAGGALGAMSPIPGGTVMGAWVGGAAASAIAHIVKDMGAKELGLRSEYDAQTAVDTLKTDMVLNLAFDAVLGAGASVIKGEALPIIKGIGRGNAKNISRAVQTVAGEDKAAEAMMYSQLIDGTKQQDWLVVKRSPEDAINVMQDIKSIHAWENLPPSVKPDASPVQQTMLEVTEQAMRGARANSSKINKQAIEEVGSLASLEKPNISGAAPLTNFKSTLAKLGVLEESEDGVMQIAKRPSDDGARIMQVFDPKSLNTLNKVLSQASSVLTPLSREGAQSGERQLSFSQAKQLLSGVDDILESSGYYKGSDMAVSNNARMALKQLRGELNQAMIGGLEKQSPQAAKIYKDEAARSHAFLNLYEDFALPSRLGGGDQKAVNTVQRMFGGTQDLDKASFRQMMQAARVDANAYVSRLEQLNAAQNLHPIVAGKGLMGAIKSMMGLNPNSMAEALSQQTIRAGRDAVAQATPVSSWSKASVEAWARGKNYLDSLKPLDKKNLMSNPALLREVFSTIINAGQPPQQMTSQP